MKRSYGMRYWNRYTRWIASFPPGIGFLVILQLLSLLSIWWVVVIMTPYIAKTYEKVHCISDRDLIDRDANPKFHLRDDPSLGTPSSE